MLQAGGKRVLVVEDDAGLRGVMAEVLEIESYEVVQAANGAQALELAQLHLPHVILLDLALPERSGLEVLKALKEAAPTREIPVIIISGYAVLLMAPETRHADGVIQKPFDVDDLVSEVGRAVARAARPEGVKTG